MRKCRQSFAILPLADDPSGATQVRALVVTDDSAREASFEVELGRESGLGEDVFISQVLSAPCPASILCCFPVEL